MAITRLQPQARTAVFSLSDGNGAPVPVIEAQEFLKNIQEMAYNFAEMKAKYDPSKTGPKKGNIKEACNFQIVNMAFASAEFEITTPEPTPELFDFDVGQEILQKTSDIFRHLSQGDDESIIKMIPDERHRTKIINRARAAIPPRKSGRSLSVATTRYEVEEVIRPDRESLKGVIATNGDLKETEEVIEKYIDAKGFALIDENNQIRGWKKIVSFEEVDSLSLQEVKGKIYTYRFKEKVPFLVTREDEYFILEYEPLSILIRGKTHDDLYKDLGEEFDFLWNEYAEESDEALHPSGKSLKDKILDLVGGRIIND